MGVENNPVKIGDAEMADKVLKMISEKGYSTCDEIGIVPEENSDYCQALDHFFYNYFSDSHGFLTPFSTEDWYSLPSKNFPSIQPEFHEHLAKFFNDDFIKTLGGDFGYKPIFAYIKSIEKQPKDSKVASLLGIGLYGRKAQSMVPSILKLNDENNFPFKIDVANVLGKIGPGSNKELETEALDALHKLVSYSNDSSVLSDDSGVRSAAAEALHFFGKSAVEILKNRLTEETDGSALKHITSSLFNLGEVGALLEIAGSADSKWTKARPIVMEVLGIQKEEKVIPVCIAALGSHDQYLEDGTKHALASLGSAAVTPLLDVLNDKNAHDVAKILRYMPPDDLHSFLDLPNNRVKELIKALDSKNPAVKNAAIILLKNKADLKTTRSVANSLIGEIMENQDLEARSESLRLLAAIDKESAEFIVVNTLKEDRDPNFRVSVAQILGEDNGLLTINTVRALLGALNDKTPEVNCAANNTIKKLGPTLHIGPERYWCANKVMVGLLKELAKSDKNKAVRDEAIDILANYAAPNLTVEVEMLVDLFKKLAKDKNRAVSNETIDILGKFAAPDFYNRGATSES